MGDGLNIPGGVRSQVPIQETNNAEESPTEIKQDTPSADPQKESPYTPDSANRKMERRSQGVVFKYELNKKFDDKALYSDSLKAADKVFINPKLSNEAKIAELQNLIGKMDKAEFQKFLSDYKDLPQDQQQFVNSAITESEKIMGRIGTELPQAEQLKVIQEAMTNPLKAKSSKEQEKRLERFDKAVGEWMARTDGDTLNKALDGRSINIRASAKLYATMAANPAQFIGGMGMQTGKIKPENLEIAQALMNIAVNPERPPTREVIEGHAYNLIMKHIEEEDRAKSRMTRK